MLGCLAFIFLQDVKDRKVSLFLLLSGMFLGGALHMSQQNWLFFLFNIGANIGVVFFIFIILWGYAKIKLQKSIFEVFGLGDLLFFLLLSVSLPTLSFLVLFTASLVFSLLLFLLLKSTFKEKTVPLAGFQALFFSLVLVMNEVSHLINIYAI
jgi:hypothetical protein